MCSILNVFINIQQVNSCEMFVALFMQAFTSGIQWISIYKLSNCGEKKNKKQKTKKAPTVGSESYLKLALKIVKLSAPRSCLFTWDRGQIACIFSVAIWTQGVAEQRNQNCYQFVYYNKKCHDSYLELHGFSVSFVAVGKLQVGIVSSVIKGEERERVSASK